MIDVLEAGLAGAASLILCLGLMMMQQHRPANTRGMVGLALTVVHMMVTLVGGAATWMAFRPARPIPFVLGGLVFYWLSLIILVSAIIRWIHKEPPESMTSAARTDSKNSA